MALKKVTELSELLVAKPGYRRGWPCLRGTGITVHNVAARYLMGATVADMCQSNPDLDAGLFHAALAYYFANKERVETELAEEAAENESIAAMYPNGVTAETFRGY